ATNWYRGSTAPPRGPAGGLARVAERWSGQRAAGPQRMEGKETMSGEPTASEPRRPAGVTESDAVGGRPVTGTRSRWVARVAGLAAGAVAVGGGVLAAGWLATGRHPGPTAQGGRAGPVGPGDTATTSSGSASASAVPGPSGSASADSSAP